MLIGLTGGIASGKSTVSKYLRDQGYALVDADRINHELMEPGATVYRALVNHYGPWILSDREAGGDSDLQTIDRRKLGSHVFGRPDRLEELNQISHPIIYREIQERIHQYSTEGPKHGIIFIDLPLLFETEAGERLPFDRIWLVYARPELQHRRLMDRDGLSELEAENRIRSQMPMEEKRKLADLVIVNEGDLADLYRSVDEAIKQSIHG